MLFQQRFHSGIRDGSITAAAARRSGFQDRDELVKLLRKGPRGRLNACSSRGPWTDELLRLIARRPDVSAAKLAATLALETQAFEADVRKLKELGLTISHDVGYSLSLRGRALLARRAR